MCAAVGRNQIGSDKEQGSLDGGAIPIESSPGGIENHTLPFNLLAGV